MTGKILTVYGRTGCHLCEEMEQALRALQAEWGFSVEVVDVESDPQLEEQYGHLVPVLTIGGEEICHYFLETDALVRCLSRR